MLERPYLVNKVDLWVCYEAGLCVFLWFERFLHYFSVGRREIARAPESRTDLDEAAQRGNVSSFAN